MNKMSIVSIFNFKFYICNDIPFPLRHNYIESSLPVTIGLFS